MQPSTLQQLMSNEQLMPLPKYDEAFYLYSFKITPCSNTLSHNWSLCPFVHAKEKARRRYGTCGQSIACLCDAEADESYFSSSHRELLYLIETLLVIASACVILQDAALVGTQESSAINLYLVLKTERAPIALKATSVHTLIMCMSTGW